jgi:hypothetical protein
MKKLADKLRKVDIELPRWTREILYQHLLDVCKDIKQHKATLYNLSSSLSSISADIDN